MTKSVKHDPTQQYVPPQRFRGCEETVHNWIADFQKSAPGRLPTMKWLMAKSGLSMGTVVKYRATFQAERPPAQAETDARPGRN